VVVGCGESRPPITAPVVGGLIKSPGSTQTAFSDDTGGWHRKKFLHKAEPPAARDYTTALV
jgi:hypothetical protein